VTATPIVSVLVASRDAAAWLPQALRSAQRQTLAEIEIIVVDDGSSDGSWDLLLRRAARDPRIRPLRRPEPGGPSAARNLALRHARGRWVAPLDADDAFRRGRLARLVQEAEARDADMIADDLVCRDIATGRLVGRHLGKATIALAPQPLGLAALIARDMPDDTDGGAGAIGYLKPVIRRDFLQRHGLAYREDIRGSEDLLFYAECVAAGARFLLSEAALYLYRLREGSLSRQPGQARHQAAANRHMARVAAAGGDADALGMLRHRQMLLDRAALTEAAQEGSWLSALALARWHRPGLLAQDLRVVAGAARRRLAA
jgi:glycosyltransferase involved in cell wall biosynthesis